MEGTTFRIEEDGQSWTCNLFEGLDASKEDKDVMKGWSLKLEGSLMLGVWKNEVYIRDQTRTNHL